MKQNFIQKSGMAVAAAIFALLSVATSSPAFADTGLRTALSEPTQGEGSAPSFACDWANLATRVGSVKPSALEAAKARQANHSSSANGGGASTPCDAEQALASKDSAATTRGTPRARHIPVSRTIFDSKWSRARLKPSSVKMQQQLQSAGVSSSTPLQIALARINQHVNQSITYKTDDVLYGQRDYWATAEETLKNSAGDCEDFAILKMEMLKASGFPGNKVRLHLMRDLAANGDHAFLVVKTPAGEMVLDNRTNRVYPLSETRDIRPVLSLSEERRWIYALAS